jgi:aminomethyltransferase
MKKTPLYDLHLKLGAKVVPFSGWEMPLSYTGVVEEHHAVRNEVGLFDISHMGRFELSGVGAKNALAHIVPSPLNKIKRGQAQYSMLLNEAGGVIDDIYIYQRGVDLFFLIVNAANRAKDFAWIASHLPDTASLKDVSDETALLALQGPKSWDVLLQTIPFGMEEIALRTFIDTEFVAVRGAMATIARTGYTGERGYEIIVPAHAVERVWNSLMEAGGPLGIKPAGLGARDTLRLEKGYPLYGHEINDKTTPVEAGLGQFLDLKKEFIGSKSLKERQSQPPTQQLIGFELTVGGVPREGYPIYSDQKEVGTVTSGNFSPSLKRGIGMGYVDTRYAEIGNEIFVMIRDREAAGVIVKMPFYRKSK